MNKKLAILNHNLGSGGAEKLIYDMSIELQKRNIEFSVILLTKINDIYGEKLLEKGIEVIYLSNKWDIYSPKNIFRLKKILKKYEVIYVNTYAVQLWTAFVSLLMNNNKKYILTEHSTTNRRRGKIYFQYLDKWMYSRYTTIISITNKVQNELKAWIGSTGNHQVIENGIDIEKYKNIKSKKRIEFGLKDEDKLICQVARFDKLKAHETTIEALKILPEDYKVIFLGEGYRYKEISEMVKEYKLEKRVYFLGYRLDAAEIIKMCDVSILTSKYEGLPISAIEGMYLNPFIGSDVAGIRELVQNYGEMFKYKDFVELSKKIKELLNNKVLYNEKVKSCKKRAEEFDIKNTVDKYLKVFNI